MCTEKCRRAVTPKKFFCWPLQKGALLVGSVMTVILVIVVACTGVQVYETAQTVSESSTFTHRNNYSYSVVAVVYCLFLLGVCLWFLWGVHKAKATVVLSWLVIMTLWLAQTFILLLVLIYLHSAEVNFIAWILAMLFGIAAICVLSFGLLVVLGFWMELKDTKKATTS